jgi:hypothetical protein|tara:strand:- start:34110 stop:34214 length:105 start_codon:yes stop_codon:yes gene_type:complete
MTRKKINYTYSKSVGWCVASVAIERNGTKCGGME